MSGTEPLPDSLWLPVVGTTRATLITPLIAIAVLALVWWLLRATQWGLEVRASGLSQPASQRLGVPAIRRTIQAMLVCGGAAGIAGALQVLGVYHALVPNLASGIGFIGLLVALLINADIRFVAPLVLLFAVLTAGSIQLPLSLSIDSSVSGVFQGFLVLAMIVARAVMARKERG
jgi:simple sugar transport system permease protein